MPSVQDQQPVGLHQETQNNVRQPQQFSLAAVYEEKDEADFFWDAHKAAAVDPAVLPGMHLKSPSAAPSVDRGDADPYPGAIGISVFTFLKIVGVQYTSRGAVLEIRFFVLVSSQ